MVMRPTWFSDRKDGECGHMVTMVIVGRVMTMAGSSVLDISWYI